MDPFVDGPYPRFRILGRELLHIGTDEAGYGPLLGPLVIAASVFETEGGRGRLRRKGIDDSKVVYARGGRDALARELGPFLGAGRPLRLSALLQAHSVRGDPRAPYAWYGDVTDATPQRGRAPAAFRALFVNPVCERDFNQGCGEWGGKAGLLFRETLRLVRKALETAPQSDAEVVCDKHGGRNRYAALLLAELGASSLVTERESRAASAYRLRVGGRRIDIRFVARADAGDMPVALASMAAKYVRELFMEGLNRFFADRVDGLRPTAGYHVDGRRFIAEVEPVLAEMRCDRDRFVRVR